MDRALQQLLAYFRLQSYALGHFADRARHNLALQSRSTCIHLAYALLHTTSDVDQ
jgi:hypothetical protein